MPSLLCSKPPTGPLVLSFFKAWAYIALYDMQLNLLPAPCSPWPPTIPCTHLRMLASSISSLLFIQISSWLAFSLSPTLYQGFSGGSDSKESACNAGDPGLMTGSGKSPGEGMATHSSIPAGEFHGQRSMVCYSPRGCKKSDMTEWLTPLLHFKKL